jgi:predicted ester cyclase
MATPAQQNERTVRGLFETVINGTQYDRLGEFCSPDVVMNRPGGAVAIGLDEYEDHYRALHRTFPDLEAALTDVVSDGTRVATRFTVTATHEGELLGIEATGTRVTFPAQIMFRLGDGTVVEEFHQSDRTTLRKQLRH